MEEQRHFYFGWMAEHFRHEKTPAILRIWHLIFKKQPTFQNTDSCASRTRRRFRHSIDANIFQIVHCNHQRPREYLMQLLCPYLTEGRILLLGENPATFVVLTTFCRFGHQWPDSGLLLKFLCGNPFKTIDGDVIVEGKYFGEGGSFLHLNECEEDVSVASSHLSAVGSWLGNN